MPWVESSNCHDRLVRQVVPPHLPGGAVRRPVLRIQEWVDRRPLTAVVLLTVTTLSCAGRRFPGDNPQTVGDVIAAVRAYDAASRSRDSIALGRMLAAEYRYFNSRGVVRSREWALGFHLSPARVLASVVRDELEVVLHDSVAVVSSRWRGSGTYEGEPYDDDQRCTLTWVFDDGAWRLLAEQCTNMVQ